MMCWYVTCGFKSPGPDMGTVGADGFPIPPPFWKLMLECAVPGGRPGGWLRYATAVIVLDGFSNNEAVSA